MKLLKIITTRNAFSREYGTWLIVLFNLIYIPFIFNQINQRIIFFSISVIFFLMFRFELLDYFSITIQHKRRKKLILAIVYLTISGVLFYSLKLNLIIDILMAFTGIALTAFNILTRRKKGKRQPLLSQIILVIFIATIGSFNYYLLFDKIDNHLLTLLVINALYYIISVIYVRSKTEGAPYHIIALVLLLVIIGVILIIGEFLFLRASLIFLFIPSLVKLVDNLILENNKVPLRRIGVNEVFHCVLFLILMNYWNNNVF